MIGGQAVIEGVMFVSSQNVSLGVRAPNKKIVTEKYPRKPWLAALRKIPFVRGVIGFAEMLLLGIKYLNRSAELATGESEGSLSWIGIVGAIFGFILMVSVFKFLPFFTSHLLYSESAPRLAFTLTEGCLKLVLLLCYLALIGQMSDIERVFQYHGAEHKVIRAVEAGKALTVKNVAAASRLHPRCGTSFVIFVIAVSIIVYSFISLGNSYWAQFGLRLLLLPVVAAIAFELLYLTAKAPSWLEFLRLPGYGVQLLTTREPDHKQIEVAIASFKALGVTKEDLK
jgi:uncharacterized protein YqhQ